MTDPLADALCDIYWKNKATGWETYARAAREHSAAEIEARIDTPPMLERDSVWYDGMANAARIARGQT